jgi:hypothetical protein
MLPGAGPGFPFLAQLSSDDAFFPAAFGFGFAGFFIGGFVAFGAVGALERDASCVAAVAELIGTVGARLTILYLSFYRNLH